MKSHERRVWAIAVHVALSGALWGLDTGSIGPIIQMTQFRASIGYQSTTKQGLYVSCFLLAAAISALASGHVSDRVSRKYGILFGGIITMIGAAMSACSPNLVSLFVARVITGLGVGQSTSIAAVYLVEIPPVEVRGRTASLLQLYIVTGIAVGYFVPFASRNLEGSLAWRVPFIFQASVAGFFCIGMYFVPFSPRWLFQRDRMSDVRNVLNRLRDREVAKQEFHLIETSLQDDQEQRSAHFMEMFDRRYLKQTLLSIFIMIGMQTTGIDAILLFSPIFFQQAGLSSERASFLASGIGGILMVVCTLPAQIWLDRWGRRRPLIIGGLAMAFSFLTIGAIFAGLGKFENGAPMLPDKAAQWTVVILIYFFIANFSWSWASVTRVYANEIVPTRLRAKVCALGQLANWAVNFVIAFTTPSFLRSSLSGLYFLYGALTLAAAIVCIFIPETKGRSLEDIELSFQKEYRQCEKHDNGAA